MESEVGWLPSDSKYFSAVCRQISRHDKNPWNRLVSIFHDAQFVQSLQKQYPFPFVANLRSVFKASAAFDRCGAWYLREPQGTSYFKSTDGHHGNWSFSTARLNLHLLEVVAATGGVVIVDATRRGKRFPDALTKTIPIWIAALNRALGLETEGPCWYPELAASEVDAILARLDGWVAALLELRLDLVQLKRRLQKRMKPYWVAQDDVRWPQVTQESYPVVLISASANLSRTPRRQAGYAFEYVPGEVSCCGTASGADGLGAADDEESWSHGLTPLAFWRHAEMLLSAGPSELEASIESLLEVERGRADGEASLIGFVMKPNGEVAHAEAMPSLDDAVLYCGLTAPPPSLVKRDEDFLWLGIEESKVHKAALMEALPRALDYLRSHVQRGQAVLICDTQPRGVYVALSVAARISCLSDQKRVSETGISKLDVRRALAAVAQGGSSPSPSRALMKQVFNFFHQKGALHRPVLTPPSIPREASTGSETDDS